MPDTVENKGSGEPASPSGSHPTGAAASASSSQSDFDPSRGPLDRIADAYETRVAAVPEVARRFAAETWGETWAHAEMGSLLDFAALLSPAFAAAIPSAETRDHVASARLIPWEPGSLGGVELTFESGLRAALSLSEGSAIPSGGCSRAANDVLAERSRQVEAKGWTPEHDDEHAEGEISDAAACYAAGCIPLVPVREGDTRLAQLWPWASSWWKPKDHRSNLVRAGAMILAEIERLDRSASSEQTRELALAALSAWPEPTPEMEKAFETAYWAKSGDIASPTPTERPEDGGGPFGYGYRAMVAAMRRRVSDEHPTGEDAQSAAEGEACQRGGEAETPSLSPSPHPNPISEARTVLDRLDPKLSPEEHVRSILSTARVIDRLDPDTARRLEARADAIQSALRILSEQEAGDV